MFTGKLFWGFNHPCHQKMFAFLGCQAATGVPLLKALLLVPSSLNSFHVCGSGGGSLVLWPRYDHETQIPLSKW